MSDPLPDLAEQLRAAVRADGRGQRELAREAGVDQAQLSRFLSGSRSLNLAAVSKLCQVLRLRLVKEQGEGGGGGEAGQAGAAGSGEDAEPADETPGRRTKGRRKPGGA